MLFYRKQSEGGFQMKKITILLTKYSDWISNMVYIMEGGGYTHASLGLEEEEDTLNHLKKELIRNKHFLEF